MLLSLHTQKLKGFQLQGDFAPLTRGSVPGPRWGLCPQIPDIGSLYALAMSVHPTYFDLATPLAATHGICLELVQPQMPSDAKWSLQ